MSLFGSTLGLAATRAFTETPSLVAMEEKVSPLATVYSVVSVVTAGVSRDGVVGARLATGGACGVGVTAVAGGVEGMSGGGTNVGGGLVGVVEVVFCAVSPSFLQPAMSNPAITTT